MNLLDIINRTLPPEPWAEGDNIPWNDPDFSRRMLKEHLDQSYDAASRRTEIIDKHVNWIHGSLLKGEPGKILDLGCGPGLYSSRLAKLGHECTGIDYSPASIEYAREQADAKGLNIDYRLGDIRETGFGGGYGLAMLIFGEFNVFCREHSTELLKRINDALPPDGILLMEAQTFNAVKSKGNEPRSWFASEGGLFSDEPHICLKENFWDKSREVATTRYIVVDAESGVSTSFAQSAQGYDTDGYKSLLDKYGFVEVEFYPLLGGVKDECAGDLITIVARKG
ncbi:MAG: class I SAM-dependent methyltransferase [bacterium]|nr:class I SAM-dependent methyltransferase [bacterium]